MEVLAYQHAALLYEAYLLELKRHPQPQPQWVKSRRGVSRRAAKTLSVMTLRSFLLMLFLGLGLAQPTLAVLSRGSRGPAVTALQLNLKNAGYFQGTVDGVFGAATDRAVRRFQRARGLVADGVVGPATEGALTGGSPGTPRPPVGGGASERTRTLQRLLANQRCYDGPIDGIYGPGTTAAVLRAQRAYGLVADGIPGPATLSALRTSRCRCT